MVRNTYEDIGNAVAIDIRNRSHAAAKFTAKLKVLNHLKLWIIELSYHAEAGAAQQEDLADVLGHAKARIHASEISILKGRADGKIWHAVRVDVIDHGDRITKVGGRILDIGIE